MKFYFVSYCDIIIRDFFIRKPPIVLHYSRVIKEHPFEFIKARGKIENSVLLNWKEITEEEYNLFNQLFPEQKTEKNSLGWPLKKGEPEPVTQS